MKKSVINDVNDTLLQKTRQPWFVFSAPCIFKGVSYKPGQAITDEKLINELLKNPLLKTKGQLNLIEV